MTTYEDGLSRQLFESAKSFLAGGVGSGVRAFLPIFVERGSGSHVYDVDENEYIDCLLSLGPLILGHRPERVIQAVTKQLVERGSMYGMPHRLEQVVCQKIIDALPSAELVSFANSGSEAVMLALRVARAFTGKQKIIKFEGHYHGWTDVIAFSSGPPLGAAGLLHAPRPVPDSPATPDLYGDLIIVQPWNNPEILEETIRRNRHEVAAVIMEPIMGNTGCILPKPGYLEFVRKITAENDILLIFDEVITGFRVAFGGAQAYYGVTPDLTTMAKALGGGFPVAAVAGKLEIMDLVARGDVGQYGTYCTSPLVMAAANAVLDELAEPNTYEQFFSLTNRLTSGLVEIITRAGHEVVCQGVGPFFQLFFADGPVHDYRQAATKVRSAPYVAFQRAMQERGVLFHSLPFENWFISKAHSDKDIDEILNKAEDAIRQVK
jgi:glutamate-1-semialdehyde 2,1-aminomutase